MRYYSQLSRIIYIYICICTQYLLYLLVIFFHDTKHFGYQEKAQMATLIKHNIFNNNNDSNEGLPIPQVRQIGFDDVLVEVGHRHQLVHHYYQRDDKSTDFRKDTFHDPFIFFLFRIDPESAGTNKVTCNTTFGTCSFDFVIKLFGLTPLPNAFKTEAVSTIR
uniref:CSON005066 protein n=1 Tax=Culicoides sonorensis TaxID=179676 RepID=A0A336MWA5_CULSO